MTAQKPPEEKRKPGRPPKAPPAAAPAAPAAPAAQLDQAPPAAAPAAPAAPAAQLDQAPPAAAPAAPLVGLVYGVTVEGPTYVPPAAAPAAPAAQLDQAPPWGPEFGPAVARARELQETVVTVCAGDVWLVHPDGSRQSVALSDRREGPPAGLGERP